MRGELGTYASGLKGHVRLLSNTVGATEFLPHALAAFLAAHPSVNIDLEKRTDGEIVQAVSEGFADAGILVDRNDLGDLETFPFATDRLVLITPRKHPLSRLRQIAFHRILDQEFVGLSQGRVLQEYLGRQAARACLPMKLRVRLNSFDTIYQLVEHGVGVAVIPETSARYYRTRAIRIIPLTDIWALRNLVLCMRQFDELSEHARHLIEHLTASALPPASDGRPRSGRRTPSRDVQKNIVD